MAYEVMWSGAVIGSVRWVSGVAASLNDISLSAVNDAWNPEAIGTIWKLD